MHTNPRFFSKSRSLPLLIATAAFAVLAFAVQASAQRIITYDVPGAGTGAWQGTQPMTINPEGAITGSYTDSNNVVHGFLRRADER